MICAFSRPWKKFTSVPLSSDWLLVIFPLFWLVPVIKNHCAYFFVNWQEYILEVSQRANKNDFLVTEADVFSPSFPFYFFFFFTFQEVTWAKMWIRRRWPNSINRWPRWWTPGSSNKWVRVQCDQPEFFNKFLCMKTFLLQWSSPLQLHYRYTDNYAVVALSRIRHKWRWYTQENEAFYWARRLPNSAFADIYRMIGLRSRYPFYYFNFIKFRFCCFRWQFDFIFRRNPGPPVHDASVPTRRGRSCEWVKKIINSQPASTIQNFFSSCFVSNTISYITLASRSNQLQQHRALY